MNRELSAILLVKLLRAGQRFGDDAEPAVREGIAIGLELAASAARMRKLEGTFAQDLDESAEQLRNGKAPP